MEHSNSTAIALRREVVSKDVGRAAGVTAHEFFHLWNVKWIRPRELVEPDLSREVYTRALWFSEGTTSYYALLTLVRIGLLDRAGFYQRVGEEIAQLRSRPGRFFQSVEEASLLTWLDKYPFYRQSENSISYYNKGLLLSLLLDLKIRRLSHNRVSLDDVLRYMNVRFGGREGFAEGEIQRSVEAVAQADLSDFFTRYVGGTEEPLWESFFEMAGWRLVNVERDVVDWGFSAVRNFDNPLVVTQVEASSPAQAAGLAVGDTVLTVNGSSELPDLNPVRDVAVEIERNGERKRLNFKLGLKHVTGYRIEEVDSPSELQLRIREGLLEGKP